MPYVITQNCCSDATCVSACPVDCIHPTPDDADFGTTDMLYVDPGRCIDCGACADACPVDAVLPDWDLTDEMGHYPEINAAYFTEQHVPVRNGGRGSSSATVTPGPLRVAIVGTGPSAFYTAQNLAAVPGLDAAVSLIDRLPAPGGLVRYGVAPDHPGTKQISDVFLRLARAQGNSLFLNVEVGRDVTHEELLEHHHAVVYATGASIGADLGIPGENAPGSYTAAEIVSWYNGHPDAVGHAVELGVDRVVVIGNGNVALDIARILLADPEALRASDADDSAVAALAAAGPSEVVVLGRRGPADAACSVPELLALKHIPGIDLAVDTGGVDLELPPAASWTARRKHEFFVYLAQHSAASAGRKLTFAFHRTPQEILGGERVVGVRVSRTLAADATTETFDCGAVVRAVGFRSAPLPSLPHDESRGVVPHELGRVVDAQGEPVAGTYVVGWAKRGPSGVIGSNRHDARETVEALVADHRSGDLASPRHPPEAFGVLLTERGVRTIDEQTWAAIDSHERASGRAAGRSRTKLASAEAMFEAIASGGKA
ncbi:MAG: 4Fe-4S binding protein [Pseudonocardia sp.]|uniref:4Fe-4S binding protein n=1 Tax=unclassified Pseudonocardia TaxID=2619320 RepID=UPI00086EAF1F|nr:MULTISPECIES: 4Fe-4S binding protein [unclassified Pseudonocardia]MBN9113564.1 4Fe-4S binding protein [Pseudonocardia sp.]ODU28946.1 MAG: hypothetical protein ABS80_02220 [Pseudonocardia sp. SCN 72-51]ODU99527.1 MAG: hypothetical protein ABT15_31550 [Pseudonocardia sp. SCN 73-27]